MFSVTSINRMSLHGEEEGLRLGLAPPATSRAQGEPPKALEAATPTYDCVYLTAEPFPSRKPYLVSITSLVLPVSSKADFSSTATYLHTVGRREHKRFRGVTVLTGSVAEHLGQQQEAAPGTGHVLASQRNNQEWLSCFHWRTLEAGAPKPMLQCKPAALAQLRSRTGSALPAGFPPKASASLPQTALFLLEEDGVFLQCKSHCGSKLLLVMTAGPTWYWFCALSALGTLGLSWGPSSWQGLGGRVTGQGAGHELP